MSSPAVTSAVRGFYEHLLVCRPPDPVAFAAAYFEDEARGDPEYRHAVRSLKYVVCDDKQLRLATSSIFGHLLQKTSTASASTNSIPVDAAKSLVSTLIDENYIQHVPKELRTSLDCILTETDLSYSEFEMYVKLVVRTSVLLQSLKDLISAACACRLTEGLDNSQNYDTISASEFLACMSNHRIRIFIARIPVFSDVDCIAEDSKQCNAPFEVYHRTTESDGSGMYHVLVTVVKNIAQSHGGHHCVSAGDIVKEFLGIR